MYFKTFEFGCQMIHSETMMNKTPVYLKNLHFV